MDDIEMQVRTIVGHHTVVSNDPHATWGEIGVDSLALAQIHYETEDKLGVRITQSEMWATFSMDQLVELVRRKKS